MQHYVPQTVSWFIYFKQYTVYSIYDTSFYYTSFPYLSRPLITRKFYPTNTFRGDSSTVNWLWSSSPPLFSTLIDPFVPYSVPPQTLYLKSPFHWGLQFEDSFVSLIPKSLCRTLSQITSGHSLLTLLQFYDLSIKFLFSTSQNLWSPPRIENETYSTLGDFPKVVSSPY